jgi:YggT family protein
MVGTLVTVLVNSLGMYLVLLLVRVLLSWFPNVDWSSNPWSILSQLTDPYLNIFRSIIPPIGGIDLSAVLALFLVQFLRDALMQIAQGALG